MISNRNFLFQGSIFRFNVCFGGCMPTKKNKIVKDPVSHGSIWGRSVAPSCQKMEVSFVQFHVSSQTPRTFPELKCVNLCEVYWQYQRRMLLSMIAFLRKRETRCFVQLLGDQTKQQAVFMRFTPEIHGLITHQSVFSYSLNSLQQKFSAFFFSGSTNTQLN